MKSGKSEEEHLLALEEVLNRLVNSGLRVKMKKCEFMKPYVDYLGHRIDAEGLHPLPDKVEAIHNAPSPQSVQELKAYLGLLTFIMASFYRNCHPFCFLFTDYFAKMWHGNGRRKKRRHFHAQRRW